MWAHLCFCGETQVGKQTFLERDRMWKQNAERDLQSFTFEEIKKHKPTTNLKIFCIYFSKFMSFSKPTKNFFEFQFILQSFNNFVQGGSKSKDAEMFCNQIFSGISTSSNEMQKIKSNLYYTRDTKRVTRGGIHLGGLAPGQHSSEGTSQRWRAVGDSVSDFTVPRLESHTSRSDSNIFNYYAKSV